MKKDEFGLAINRLDGLGGLDRAIAAISEGFCPTCQVKIIAPLSKKQIKKRVMDNEAYASTPSTQGMCPTCKGVWAIGTTWVGDWLALDDVGNGVSRRMSFNTPSD